MRSSALVVPNECDPNGSSGGMYVLSDSPEATSSPPSPLALSLGLLAMKTHLPKLDDGDTVTWQSKPRICNHSVTWRCQKHPRLSIDLMLIGLFPKIHQQQQGTTTNSQNVVRTRRAKRIFASLA